MLKVHIKIVSINEKDELDPVGSTVRYEVMKLCTESVWDSNGWYLVVLVQYEEVRSLIPDTPLTDFER